MKIVINTRFGGFGLSDEAYEWFIAHGIPVRKYIREKRNPKTGLYDLPTPKNNQGNVIFDRSLSSDELDKKMLFFGRYWETWIGDERTNPLLIQCVEELGEKANGRYAELKIVEIPDGTDYEIDEYDGKETIEEAHESWS